MICSSAVYEEIKRMWPNGLLSNTTWSILTYFISFSIFYSPTSEVACSPHLYTFTRWSKSLLFSLFTTRYLPHCRHTLSTLPIGILHQMVCFNNVKYFSADLISIVNIHNRINNIATEICLLCIYIIYIKIFK